MMLPLALCVAAVAVEKAGTDLFGLSIPYDVCVMTGLVCFVSAFTLGALRFPALTLPLALTATFVIPHEDCGMSVGILPRFSIMPSWMLGSLGHV